MARDFSPSDREAHRELGKQIMRYVDTMQRMAFFGPEISKKDRKKMEEGWEKARKIAKKLEKGKGEKIFKDEDD